MVLPAPAPTRFKGRARGKTPGRRQQTAWQTVVIPTEAKFESDALGFGIELRKTGSKIGGERIRRVGEPGGGARPWA
jgi:hypothetical protein